MAHKAPHFTTFVAKVNELSAGRVSTFAPKTVAVFFMIVPAGAATRTTIETLAPVSCLRLNGANVPILHVTVPALNAHGVPWEGDEQLTPPLPRAHEPEDQKALT